MQGGASAELTRTALERNRATGLQAITGSALALTDVAIRNTGSQAGDGTLGRGLQVQDGSTVEGTRLLILRACDVGLVAADVGTTIRLSHAAIRETRERACAAGSCEGLGAGHGLGAYAGGRIELTTFLLADSVTCGLQVARGTDRTTGTPFPDGGELDLHEGTVSGNAIGANVQLADYDLGRLQDGVVFAGNGRNIDAAELPVPDPDVSR